MGRLALAVLLVALVVAGLAAAGSYTPPPGDCCPQWSPKGTQIVFTGNRGGGNAVGAVAAAGGPEKLIPGIPVGVRSPDWTHVAYRKNGGLAVSRVDGSDERMLASTGGDFAWSPDSKRLAFVDASGALVVVAADGTGRKTLSSPRVASPVWSPDSARIAFVHDGDLQLLTDLGGSIDALASGPVHDPRWSTDGTRLSFVLGNDIVVLRIDDSQRRYPVGQGVLNVAWLPGDKALLYVDGRERLIRLDLPTDKRRILATGEGFVLSPDGRHIAYAAGGECRDRVGIYVAHADGTGRRRLTNSCTVRGTAGPDTLHADFSRVVLGLGGNDTLYADDTYYYFDGNSLYGGPGNDRLVGGFAQDTLDGGPGNDAITGGGSIDVITGGPGRDTIDAGGGADVVHARDGQRDVIHCGKNGYGKNGRDTVFADKVDVVASDCEIVHRS